MPELRETPYSAFNYLVNLGDGSEGEVTGGPAPRPMDLFPVSLRDGKLVVDTGQPIQRQGFDESQVFFPS